MTNYQCAISSGFGLALLATLPSAPAADKVDFAKEVWPVLQQNCINHRDARPDTTSNQPPRPDTIEGLDNHRLAIPAPDIKNHCKTMSCIQSDLTEPHRV